MVESVRAIYENGQLRLLDAVDLSNGEEVQLMILSDRAQVQSALGDLLVEVVRSSENEVDEAGLMQKIEDSFRGQLPLSQTIIEERHAGP